jgi:hypothetical protein
MASLPNDLSAAQATRLGFRSARQMQRLGERAFRRRALKQAALEAVLDAEDDIVADRMAQLKVICGVTIAEQDLSDDIQNYLTLMAFRTAQGVEVSYEEAHAAINQIAEEHGFLSGVPIPIVRRDGNEAPDLVMAAGVPLAELFHMNQAQRRAERTELEGNLLRSHLRVRNSWHMLGDQTVAVIETEKGPMALPHYDAGMRLRKLITGHQVRFHAHQRAEAEMKALESLRARISESQFDSYVLSGIFPERSPRSDVWYFFRKGYPTLAVSFHGQHGEDGKVLCALCLHPMGYYQGTHVGLMIPTDEVIAHLLLMRADERKFWAKSGQWRAEDTRSGI